MSHRRPSSFPPRLITAVFLGLVFATPAIAQDRADDGVLQSAQVVSDAKWFVHINLVELKGSKIGEELVKHIDGNAKRKIRAFERMISFNPLEDLDAVTVSGSAAEPDKAVVVLRGAFDVPHLTDLAMAADGYRSQEHAGQTIHTWQDEKTPGGRLNGCIIAENLMLFGPDLATLKAGIDSTLGKAAPFAAAANFPDVEGRRPPFVAAWADLSVLDSLKIESAFVRRVRSLHLSVGENAGQAFARVIVDAEDGRTPKLIAQMLAGVLALAEAAEQLPSEVADAIDIEILGTRLVVDGAMDLDSLVEMVESLEQLKGKL